MDDFEKKESKGKSIFRIQKKEKNFTILDNTAPHDETLSNGSKGLLWYMLTMPDNWTFHRDELARHSSDSLHQIKKQLKELAEKGYLKRQPKHREDGTNRIEYWETHVFETPQIIEKKPLSDIRTVEKPLSDIQTEGETSVLSDFPLSGKPSRLESHTVEIQPLLSTEDIQITDNTNIPVRVTALPELQKPTGLLFIQQAGIKDLSEDDLICLSMLFKIHTPAAIQKNILESFKRLEKNGGVKVKRHDEEFVIENKKDLPMRYIYNSMKNWDSLKGAGNRVAGGVGDARPSKSNVDRDVKNYARGSEDLFVQ